jgi:hypothetical protein
MFSLTVSFTDIVEKFKGNIQNPHDQSVLLIPDLADACSEPRSHCLKEQKMNREVSANFWHWEATKESFPQLFTTIAQLTIGLES